MPYIQVKNLKVKIEGKTLFNSLNFIANQSEVLELRGKNGSGKTTLLTILAGLYKNYTGYINYDKKLCIEPNRLIDFYYLGHSLGLKSNLSAIENLEYFAILNNIHFNKTKINQILKRLNLFSLQLNLVEHLSAGQKKRLALARLLIEPRKIWFLDEPLSALDKVSQNLCIQLIEEHIAKQGLVVITSHQTIETQTKVINLS